MRFQSLITLLVLGATVGAGIMCPPSATARIERFVFDGDDLILVNLIGEITIGQAAGDKFEVEVEVSGSDAGPDVLKFDSHENGDAELTILFPLDKEKNYVYPRIGRESSCNFLYSPERNTKTSWKDFFGLGKSKKVKIRGSGRGMEVWADVTVRVPEGASLHVEHGMGAIDAEDLAADLNLDIHCGSIGVRQCTGSIKTDSGNGSVIVADTVGKIDIDTGSGSVKVSGCESRSIFVDTGSGSVVVQELTCREMDIDTGSGNVRAVAVAAENARIDTGSGSVRLELDQMGDGDFDIDTGSGSISFKLPANASARVDASTGSGGIDVDLEGVDNRKNSSDNISFRVGKGDAYVRLDTGSGGIRIWQ